MTGATGYIGGRLAPMLLDAGHGVRCLTRSPEKLRDVDWAARVEVVQGDALDRADLDRAMEGVDVVYYLVHSIGIGRLLRGHRPPCRRPTLAACGGGGRGAAASSTWVGSVPGADETASPHLASRAEVGQILLDGPVPAVVLQAGVIIGSGSASRSRCCGT